MKLHWSPKSPYVRKVMVCAHELGLVDQLTLVRSVAAMLRPNALIMVDNPLSKIPTLLLDDGRTLFDSAVICEYLNDLACGDLFPLPGEARWQALRWQALGNGLTDVLILWRNEREREFPLAQLQDAFAAKFDASIALLEQEVPVLTQQPVGIGHIAIGCALGYADYRFQALSWRTKAPGLAQWHAELSNRPSFVATQVSDS